MLLDPVLTPPIPGNRSNTVKDAGPSEMVPLLVHCLQSGTPLGGELGGDKEDEPDELVPDPAPREERV